ncbi:hypothetical protein KIW84_041021 [Lathyrus oleraceus]|uniref:Uncharacterized protein n=1 Tax=Pisum sativum TaxID=3888 RepID=A0A9D4X934_PEA|nr:hypothetical protein KIW84_041021 [Pisum sativum]
MTAKDLFKHFEEFRVIGEVVIPPKRGKRGMRYRFVRFFDVVNMRRLVLHMDNLWLERRKSFSNIPRFQRVVEEMFPMVKADVTRDYGYRKERDDFLPKVNQQVVFEVREKELKRFYPAFIGKYVCCDDNTSDLSKMDVASIMVRITYGIFINEVFKVNINEALFRVRVVEETLSPSTRLVKKPISSALVLDSEFSHDSSSWEDFVGKDDDSEGADEGGSRGIKSVGSEWSEALVNRPTIDMAEDSDVSLSRRIISRKANSNLVVGPLEDNIPGLEKHVVVQALSVVFDDLAKAHSTQLLFF